MKLTGEVRRGEGSDSQRDWSEAEGALGYLAYPGTLNVKLDITFANPGGVVIYDFFTCTPATIGGIRGHLCMKKEYTDSVRYAFLVAPVCLRDELRLKHKSKVQIEVGV